MIIKNIRIREMVSLCSPMVLYSEATQTIIDPMKKTTRSVVLMGPMEELLSRYLSPFDGPCCSHAYLLCYFVCDIYGTGNQDVIHKNL
ncbi:MAG: hypothetical protein B1H12_10695 [Desulfobacteraceae bacterium 4484_190.2]|nr:MAG: hypothetical protein B1H12_10695 [Desulfobacteraceae bacterium 4484_190.2]